MPSNRAQMLHLYGRDVERERIGELLDGARASQGSALLLRGEPGIGKTARLDDARAHLRGVFAKLGLKSRTQLARVALASDGDAPPG